MDNLDDSENNAKISDSAYSNSCSNSQSRRSHSSKSTHSGSHSSGSSGYGGKPSTSGSSNILGQPPKKDKEAKKPKPCQTETAVPDVNVEQDTRPPETTTVFVAPKEQPRDVGQMASPAHALSDKGVANMEISSSERSSTKDEDGFSCVVSMHDGVVMYTTPSLTSTLGFPKDMWIGRSFIDFVHPKDHSTLAPQITSGLAAPKIVNGTQEKAQSAGCLSTVVCRIRKYRGLTSGFGVKDKLVLFVPFLLKLTFKSINDEEGKVIYLVIQAKAFFSAFKTPNELVLKAVPFVVRHAANGIIEYVDPESVPYLGYLPQDLVEKDALQLYHPEDLCYLKQVYENIVKEGGFPRCKPYRMMTQNGNYIKLETEWSSFINPWSKKLEFVIGKHHIIEGPANPDVFYSPENEKANVSAEENEKSQIVRDSIVRMMNEVLTKPAEMAKQQMSKRCQNLANSMESLMQEQPKLEDELRLDIQDPDHSYFERDSVMLGGISPHHDYNDSKSSTETRLSYNQLNYNETLQRYFGSHRPNSYEDYNTVNGENILGLNEPRPILNAASSQCPSPMAYTSGDSYELTSSCGSNVLAVCSISSKTPLGDYPPPRLTELLLTKHNVEMEKELIKNHRGTRSNSKGEREKESNETRLKKREHLARCNASFQPTTVCTTAIVEQPHGVKRTLTMHVDDVGSHKHHCPSPRALRRRQRTLSTSAANEQPSSTITTTVAASNWSPNNPGNMNTYIMGVGIPQQMPIMSPVATIPGLIPMYYTPAVAVAGQPMPSSSQSPAATANPTQFSQPPSTMPCVMYGQPFYSSPFMYTPMNPQAYPMQQSLMAQSMQYTNTLNPLSLTNRNYEEILRAGLTYLPGNTNGTRGEKKQPELQGTSTTSNMDQGSTDNSSTKALNRRTETVPGAAKSRIVGKLNRPVNNEETTDKTDGESSYSSFYSSFFKTDSGSAEDSGDLKKGDTSRARTLMDTSSSYLEPHQAKKIAKRKMEPPWMEQVCVTSELVYKYQVMTKTMEDVLASDKQKMSTFQQPSLVNEQLGQLYMDLQLDGVAARLTLEEGITSSSSSGEEASAKASKGSRRKREFSKLVMIYEEDAPLPCPSVGDKEECASRSST